jgi:hypothetical protein
MSARADLCGGRSVMIVPTATSLNADQHDYVVLSVLTSECKGNSM